MSKLAFQPKRHGYHFSNSFTNRILPGVLNGVKTEGLCGGMSMTVLDYWRAGVPIPTHRGEGMGLDLPPDPASGGARLPAEGSRLRTYIYNRQIDSLLTKAMFTRWVVSPKFGPDDFHNWATTSEFQVVCAQITNGRPALLGFWSMGGGPTSGHQVLCYGFQLNPIKLYIYDPNHPDVDCELVPVSPAAGIKVRDSTGQDLDTYRGYFFTDVYNWNQNPPYDPPYKDIVVWNGIDLQPANTGNVGVALQSSVVVRNAGEYPATFKTLFVSVRGPGGQNLDPLLGGGEPGVTQLQPGETHLIARNNANFGNAPGTYTVGVSYLSNNDDWINIPPGNAGAVTERSISLFTQKVEVADQTISVPESSSAVPTGINVQPGDDIALTGSGTIWAGVWLTGLNGPDGWMDRIETNPASPYNNRPDAHPFSLIGRFGSDPWFCVGSGFQRRPVMVNGPEELILRTNDNSPGNGAGSFQCRVQVWR
jgi:hypothetical protein